MLSVKMSQIPLVPHLDHEDQDDIMENTENHSDQDFAPTHGQSYIIINAEVSFFFPLILCFLLKSTHSIPISA